MGFEVLKIVHTASGASAEIANYGATVMSYKDASGRENMFVSETALKDGSKPIRGGIPLVFPIFGPPTPPSTMPQHGFARRNYWTVLEETRYDKEDAAGVTLELKLHDVTEGRGEQNDWETNEKYNCTLLYTVVVAGDNNLTATFTVKNTGSQEFVFDLLYHTYFQVDEHAALSPDKCFVKGLGGYSVQDKVSKTDYVSSDEPITIAGEVDRVYTPPAGKLELETTFGVGSGKTLTLQVSGDVDGTAVPISCVVWNPHQAKAETMSDFKTEQFNDMICVEPGILSKPSLPAGKEAKMVHILKVNP